MVDALRRHARLRAADADVLRRRLDRPFPRAGNLGRERQLLRDQSPGRIAPPPRPQRRLHGHRHFRHALHRHGGHAGARRIELWPPVVRALRDHRDRRGDGGSVAGVPNHAVFTADATMGAHGGATLDRTTLVLAIAGFTLADLAALFAFVSRRKRAEEVLRQTRADLAHVQRVTTMGQMAASISHEVMQPLGAVVTNAQTAVRWLDAQPPDLEEAREALGRAIKDGNRAGDVVGRIRALVKKSPPVKNTLDINNVILEVIALTRGEVMKNGVSVQTQLAEGLPLVQGDRVQLQQVIVNLIINAVEAMSGVAKDSRRLLVSTAKDVSGEVLVVVQDWGPGLNGECGDRLFDPFYTTKSNGMGMGLSICRSIVQDHGGRIWPSSRPGAGASIQFTLPSEAASQRVA